MKIYSLLIFLTMACFSLWAEKGSIAVSEIYFSGKYIKLSDGSCYEIAPSSAPMVGSWLFGPTVTLSSSSDPIYSTKITNTISNSSVLAKSITQEELDQKLSEAKPAA